MSDKEKQDPELASAMLLRDYFAAHFMAAMLSVPEAVVSLDHDQGVIGLKQAGTAYLLADAMLKAREKGDAAAEGEDQ